MENTELYQEEQRQALIDMNKGITLLSEKVQKQIDAYEVVKNVEVTGSVEVNTEKEIAVTNLGELQESIKGLGDTLREAIKENSYKPLELVKVDNIKDALPSELKVNNLSDIKEYFNSLENAIKNNQPIVNVSKQEVIFPTDPKKPIAVRLSDGKKFYDAITAAVGGGMDSQGIITAINNISTGSGSSGPFASYAQARQDLDSDPIYSGKEDATGNWVIIQTDFTNQTTMYFEGTGGISSNWAGRAGYAYVEYNAL